MRNAVAHRAMTTALQVVHGVAAPALRRALRAVVTGVEHLPRSGGVLLAANHTSNLDNYLLSAVMPRPVSYLGKQELAGGLFGAFNVAMGMVPVARGRADPAVIQRVAAVLGAGHVVALFPEGTRTPTGELFRFRSGLARIAYAAAAPVVPVGIRGTATVWPRGGRPALRRPRPGVLAVHIGALVSPPGQPRGRERREWTELVRARVAALSGQALADAFAPVDDT